MRKFFILNEILSINNEYTLSNEDSYHYIKVLRENINNEEIIICDGKNNNYSIRSIKVIDSKVKVILKDKIDLDTEPTTKLHLYMALIKSEKFDLTLQKCVEIGINEITPIFTERTIIKLDKSKIVKKIDRWNKIIFEACKQCRRSYIPNINYPIKFSEAIKKNKLNGILAYVDEKQVNLKHCLSIINSNDINIFVGPEGGFSRDEIEKAIESKVLVTHLGKRILKAETAAIVLTTLVLLND